MADCIQLHFPCCRCVVKTIILFHVVTEELNYSFARELTKLTRLVNKELLKVLNKVGEPWKVDHGDILMKGFSCFLRETNMIMYKDLRSYAG